MPNKGVKVLRNSFKASTYWYNTKYRGTNPDYEICVETDRKGTLVSHYGFGITFITRFSGMWGLRLSGISLSLRSTNIIRLARFGIGVLGTSDNSFQDAAFIWSANTKYRIRFQSVWNGSNNILKGWVWVDDDIFPEETPLINHTLLGYPVLNVNLGIIASNEMTGCQRTYVYEDVLHSLTGLSSGVFQSIQNRKAFEYLTNSDWRTLLAGVYLEMAYRGTRKTDGHFLYEPKLINVNKEFPTIGSTNFTEYWNGTGGALPVEDFVNIGSANFQIITDTAHGAPHGIAFRSNISATFMGGYYKKLGKHTDIELLGMFRENSIVNVGNNGFLLRYDESTGNPTGYTVQSTSVNVISLYRHNNSNAGTLLQDSAPLPTMIDDELHYLRVRINGNNIKARRWSRFEAEPSVWHIDYTDENGSAILNEGWVGYGVRRTSGGSLVVRSFGLAWAPIGETARFPSNTLVRWGEDRFKYGNVKMEFAASDSLIAPDDSRYLPTRNWGMIPCINWDLGTGGVDKYLFSRLQFIRGSCVELSSVSGKESELIIEGDLCSTLIDDDITKRYRKKVCYIDNDQTRRVATYNKYLYLGYKIDYYSQTSITLSKIMEYDVIFVSGYTTSTPFFELIRSAIDNGVPVVIGYNADMGGNTRLIQALRFVDGGGSNMQISSGALPLQTILEEGKAGTYAEITDPYYINQESVLSSSTQIAENFNQALFSNVGKKLTSFELVGNVLITGLAVEKNTLDLDGVSLNARVVWLGWMVYSGYSNAGFVDIFDSIFDNAIRWCIDAREYNQYGNVQITLKDSSNNPISGARISLDEIRAEETDIDGIVTFINVPVGNYTAFVTKTGYISGSQDLSVEPEVLNLVNIQYVNIQIAVKDVSNSPIQGANVNLDDLVTDDTDVNGVVTFTDVPVRVYDLIIMKEFYRYSKSDLSVTQVIPNIVEVILDTPISGVYIEDLVFALMSDDSVIVEGDKVSEWVDIISRSSISQSTAARRPDYVENQLNGKPAIRFTKTSDHYLLSLVSALNFVPNNGANACTIIALTNLTNNTSVIERVFISYGGTSTRQSRTPGVPANSNDFYIATNADNHTTTTPFNGAKISVSKFDSGVVSSRVNGVDTSPASKAIAFNTSSGGTFYIGRWVGASTLAFDGDIYEILFFNRALSLSEIQDVESYLADKYGITP